MKKYRVLILLIKLENLITNQLISANDFNPVTDTWEITLTFVNLDLNQDTNIGKTFDGHIEISPVETESDVYAK